MGKTVHEKKSLTNYLEIDKIRIPLFFPVILGLGILYGVHFPFFCYSKLITFSMAILFLTIICKQPWTALFALGVFISQTGGLLHTDLIVHKKYLQKNAPKVGFYANVGFIEETHPTMKGMQRIILKNIVFDKKNSNLNFIKNVKITCSGKLLKGISPLDNVKVFGSLSTLKNPVIPGSFDQLQYNTIMGIDATGVAFSLRKSKTQIDKNFMENFSLIRFNLTKAISQKIDGNASGIAAALLTGDKSSIKPEIRDSFTKAGIAHILAISGLHMSLVTGILFFIARKILLYLGNFCMYINAGAIASAVTIPCTFLYLALSGFSPSAIRAFIMTTIFLISVANGKKALSLKNVSLAALFILIFDPFSLFHISFQLSFAAVLALVSFYETFGQKLQQIKPNKFIKYFYLSSATTIIATIATTPISVATFNRFSTQNILGNLIAIPITSFLIAPLGVVNIFIGKFTNLLIKPLETSINLMVNLATHIASLPGSNIALKTPSTLALSLTILGGILLCLLQTKFRHIGTIIIAATTFHYIFIQKSPSLIAVPGENNIFCIIKGGKIYSNSNQKARNKIKAIARNLGLENEKIYKIDLHKIKIPSIKHPQNLGIFVYDDGKASTLKERKHPICPVTFSAIEGTLMSKF